MERASAIWSCRGKSNRKSDPTRSRWPSYAPKKESLVLDHGATQRNSKIVVLKNRLARRGIKNIPRIERAVAEKLKCRAVQMVGPGPGNDVYDRAAVPAVFGRELRLQVEFFDRFDG